mmetsp:Transcript_7636/g.20262  ORF Transcript_7636/g.20262 Transcript_7636/m.20262 type:complete len:252 (-) Transcript_7636:89-844(-)
MDYSRWDRLARELENEDERNVLKNRRESPQVTTFSEATSVTIHDNFSMGLPEQSESWPLDVHIARNGSVVRLDERATKSTSSPVWFKWGQDYKEIHVCVACPLKLRARDVRITLGPGSDRELLCSKNLRKSLHITSKDNHADSGDVLFEADLFMHVEADDEDPTFVDWEMKSSESVISAGRSPSRWVLARLKKHEPLPGVHVWWSSFRSCDAPLDVRALPDRHATAAASSQTFASNLLDAQRIFRDRHRRK